MSSKSSMSSMSSTKRLKLQSYCDSSVDKNKRHLFSERICDDLCQEIVHYLPIEDQLRLECVSKQFQRNSFQRLRVLRVESFRGNEILFNKRKINLNAMKAVLKKFNRLSSIDFSKLKLSKIDNNRVIQLILESCGHLNKISFIFNQMNKRTAIKLITKFDCTHISIIIDSLDLNILSLFPTLDALSRLTLKNVCELQFKNLTKLSLNYTNSDFPYLKLLVKECKSLKHLSIDTIHRCNHKEMEEILKQISEIKGLIHFSIFSNSNIQKWTPFKDDSYFGFGLNGGSFDKILESMAQKCTKMKSFGAYFTIDKNNIKQMHKLFAPLKTFKELKRLHLGLRIDPNIHYTVTEDKCFDFKSLQGLDHLTHLKIQIFCNSELIYGLNSTIIKNIWIYLPNLVYFEFNNKLNDLLYLPFGLLQLKKLESIKLNIPNKNSRKQFTDIIKENAKRIKTISYFNES